jgi:monoamine oxidase
MDADVIVIGAGAAGLAAARELGRRSLRVIVLEARDRVGGRVWPLASADATAPPELGAEFIHGRARETMALLRDVGMDAIETAGESWVCGSDGALQRTDDDAMSATGIFERARSLENDESVDVFLRRFENQDELRTTAATARALVEGFDAADPAIASVQAIADEWHSGVNGASARPTGGYGPMLQRLHDDCIAAGVRIDVSTIVERISLTPAGVTIDTHQTRNGSHLLRARAAVVTVPAGVLRQSGAGNAIAFDPDLPAAKQAALANIEMGHVARVTLAFQTPFWERIDDERYRDAGFFRCAGRPFPTYWTQMPVRSNLIVAWAGGPKARALNGASREELVEKALRGFDGLFGGCGRAQTEFEAAYVHDWSTDPLSRGAYSYVIVGGANARATLAAPVGGALFFAGEATADDGQAGTVNGALNTGERAAREVVAAFESGGKHD